MREIETVAELRHQVATARGRGERVGFVPTMGALHAGHLELVRTAHAQCDFVVVSAYVNPTQFGPNEDLDRYPNTPERDRDIAESGGADLLWRPLDAELWPDGPETMRVSVGPLASRLCGVTRPGHFDGVASVVTRLINAVRPDVLYLGEKDFQQLVVLQRLVRDLLLPVEVRGVPTVRDPDGLALSSRNTYLTPDERAAALAIPHALDAARDLVATGEHSAGRIRARVEVALAEARELDVEYVEIVDPDSLEPVDGIDGPARLLVAARVGTTRLIDNVELVPAPVPATTGERP